MVTVCVRGCARVFVLTYMAARLRPFSALYHTRLSRQIYGPTQAKTSFPFVMPFTLLFVYFRFIFHHVTYTFASVVLRVNLFFQLQFLRTTIVDFLAHGPVLALAVSCVVTSIVLVGPSFRIGTRQLSPRGTSKHHTCPRAPRAAGASLFHPCRILPQDAEFRLLCSLCYDLLWPLTELSKCVVLPSLAVGSAARRLFRQ
jgi:hypothetical protein